MDADRMRLRAILTAHAVNGSLTDAEVCELIRCREKLGEALAEFAREEILRREHPEQPEPPATATLGDFMARAEKEYVHLVLRQNGWNINATADALGVSRKTIWNIQKRHGIDREDG